MLRHYHERMAGITGDGRRVAFFGGSFDPPHLGHLAIARAARTALQLDAVLFAPVGYQPLKPHGSTASFDDRLAMTRLAVERQPGFEVSLADAPHPEGKPNYTLETLRTLRSGLPAGSSLYCLMGADSFVNLRHWRRGAKIPFAASLIVASRPGQNLSDLAALLPEGVAVQAAKNAENAAGGKAETGAAAAGVELRVWVLRNEAGECAPFYLLPGLDVEISATEIRRQVRGESAVNIECSLPPVVAQYIQKHRLYL